jgi:hypothetical protein
MAERKIGTRTFKVDQPLATEAIRLQARVVRALGPSLEKFFTARDQAARSGKVGDDALGLTMLPIIADFYEKNDPDEVTALVTYIMTFAKVAHQSGQYDQVDLDGDFYGQLGDIIPVCMFVLQEVLGDFFTGPGRTGSPATKTTAAA